MIRLHNYKLIMLFSITATFVLPLFLAWLVYSRGAEVVHRTVNHGTLISPPVSVSLLSLTDKSKSVSHELKGKWWLMYVTDSPEDSISQRNLYFIRQIRQATGKNRDRIERALVTLDPKIKIATKLLTQFPGTSLFTVSPGNLDKLDSRVPKKLALKKASLYLVDPLGNIMMSYAPDAAPKGILKDLERVLKVSQIG